MFLQHVRFNFCRFCTWVVLPAAARISPIVLFAAAFTCAYVLISENFRTLLLMLWFGCAETRFLPLIIVSIKTIPQHTIPENILVFRKFERFSKSNPFKCTVLQAEELETITINVVVFHPIDGWTFLFAVHSYMYDYYWSRPARLVKYRFRHFDRFQTGMVKECSCRIIIVWYWWTYTR